MTATRITHSQIVAPEQVAALITLPTVNASAAGAVADIVNITAPSLRVPLLTELPTAQVIPEGAEYPLSTTSFGEVQVTPPKIGVADVLTRELADDSAPEAQRIFAAALAAALAVRVDAGFIGTDPVAGMPGLEQIAATAVSAGTAWSSLDPLIDGLSVAETAGTHITTWLMNPADRLAFRKIKVSVGSVQTLLSPDATSASIDGILGIPVITNPAVPAGTIYGIPRDRMMLVVRDAAEVATDKSIYFLSDRIAVKASVRIGWLCTDPKAVARIKLTP